MNRPTRLLPIDMLKKKQLSQKITMLTAYDAMMAALLDEAEVDMVLVGDSVANRSCV